MVYQNKVHEKIIQVLKERGPSLPIKISKEIEMNSLFTSAFLSELTNEKRIKVSNLKVGGSPLYFLNGQEEQLEKFYKYLHPKEAEIFLLLKKNKILKDSEQEPATRVALRSIKDFSMGLKKDNEIYWKYFLTSESEINKILFPSKQIKKKIKEDLLVFSESNKKSLDSKRIKLPFKEKQTPKKSQVKTRTKILEFQNPLATKLKIKPKKQKSEFVEKIINFIKEKEFKIIEERDYTDKEYNCLIQIKSELGGINFLTQAKNKKIISETDLKKLLSNAQSIPLPALMIYSEKFSKKAKEYLTKYYSILKVLKIK